MKEFQLTRYLRNWWWIICLVSALSGIAFYSYTVSRQTYQAQTMIEFTNESAAEGLYPTGQPIDVQEICSSVVISNALDSLNQNRSVDQVRRRISIRESLTEDEAAIREANLAAGLTYDNFPTRYIITYTSERGESPTLARQTVEAVIDSFIRLYSEKYVSVSKVPNTVDSLQNLDYDYIEWAEVIDSYIKQTRDYLDNMKSMRTQFRSSVTGYSFQDLYNEYNLIYTVYLPSLYAAILGSHVTTDRDMLTARYTNRIAQNDLTISSCEESIDVVEEMIANYTDKNHDTMDYHWKGENESTDKTVSENTAPEAGVPGSSYVLGTVYDFEGRDNYKPEETTYDIVIDRYVKLRGDISAAEADNVYCNFILDALKSSPDQVQAADEEKVKKLISLIEEKLRALDLVLNATAAEHSEVETVRNVRVRSTVNVSEVTNVRLYTLLIVVVFFIFGIAGAVVVGRGMDFVDYRFYTDPSTGLPNRLRCDQEIERLSKKMLTVPFTCAAVSLANMNEINDLIGRDGGNEVLHIFADYLQDCSESYGFVGYNGGLQFLGFFPDCDTEKAEGFHNLLTRVIGEFNRGNHGICIRFRSASATATAQAPSTMHELLSSSIRKLSFSPVIFPKDSRDAGGEENLSAKQGKDVSGGREEED